MMVTLINTLTKLASLLITLKERKKLKQKKGMRNFFYFIFFPRYFELCLMFQKVKIVDFRFS